MSEAKPTFYHETEKLAALRNELNSLKEQIVRGLGTDRAERYFKTLPQLIKQAETSVKTVATTEIANSDQNTVEYVDKHSLLKYKVSVVTTLKFNHKDFKTSYPDLDKQFSQPVSTVRLTTSKLK